MDYNENKKKGLCVRCGLKSKPNAYCVRCLKDIANYKRMAKIKKLVMALLNEMQ